MTNETPLIGLSATQRSYMDVPATDAIFGVPVGVRRVYTHSQESCKGEDACPIHKPSDHHMREWPMLWRADKGVLERTCPHGCGHPDPDQLEFWERIGADWKGSHGCDGCCTPEVEK